MPMNRCCWMVFLVFLLPGPAVFALLGKKFTCESCHPEPFPQKAGAVEEQGDFTMAAFREGKYCGKCHDGKAAFSVETRCNWCHIGVQGHKHLEEYHLNLKKQAPDR